MAVTAEQVKELAAECGFELAGITPASPLSEFARFDQWRNQGYGAEMQYLTDRRGDLRADPRHLLPSAQTIVCVGKLYNSQQPSPEQHSSASEGHIARYVGARDYHDVLRANLKQLAGRIEEAHGSAIEWRACVDTAPLLERSYAREAGLGWIGRNTCLIHEGKGSWFFLGELLLSIALVPDTPPPDRCGTCRRCIDACPTEALVPDGDGWALDARRCISYLTVETRGPFSADESAAVGSHVFGCDICQDVCPWNRRAAVSEDPLMTPHPVDRSLERMAALTAEEFRREFRDSTVWRTRYEGFLRNVAAALGNSHNPELRPALEQLSRHASPVVAEAARQALARKTAEEARTQEAQENAAPSTPIEIH